MRVAVWEVVWVCGRVCGCAGGCVGVWEGVQEYHLCCSFVRLTFLLIEQ